ncbi:MAG: bifunctional phosphopantothenoylcysteine decarboxylase/phosphopantothenate--cysteine ligase CoaBC [Bacteroidota bacterium]
MLKGKKIVVAISGSIAAYKIAFFVRLLVKEHAQVKVIITESAKNFITPLTLSTLSKNPVYSDYFDAKTGEWTNHVELGLWADLMIVTPLSANTLGKMANGICDNLLLATYLSAKCPVLVAPAMDLDMYKHPTTLSNLNKLKSFGNQVIEATEGELASGLVGQGRMAEPEDLILAVRKRLGRNDQLKGRKVLITSGPTHEAIDPVRFIGNHSSGKMGAAIAEAFIDCGASVSVVAGPSKYLPNRAHVVKVNSAEEMLKEAEALYPTSDIVVFAAAVADYRPANVKKEKIKKNGTTLELSLVKNPDIAWELGNKKKHQLNIGFALETHQEDVHAKEKLKKKNFDLIVLNSLNDKGAGFQNDTNKVTFFDKNNKETKFELKSKSDVAIDIVDYVIANLK